MTGEIMNEEILKSQLANQFTVHNDDRAGFLKFVYWKKPHTIRRWCHEGRDHKQGSFQKSAHYSIY